MSAADTRRIRSYGRRRGRKLRPARQAALDSGLASVSLDALPADGTLDPRGLFAPAPKAAWLEIGFGGGEHLAWQAAANPDVGILGAEPFVNGVASLLAQVGRQGLRNVRVWPDDAGALLAALAEGSIDRAFLLFPDPWPKARHHKRRIVNPANLDALARILADDAEFRVATDDEAYLGWILTHILGHRAFAWIVRDPSDWRRRPVDWPATRYEEKAGRSGRKPYFLSFRRRARP
jgi:tRNA (guanine-N7-)-methyltransferase